MSTGNTPDSIMQEVLSGENPELQRLVAQGLFPLPPEQLISLQIALVDVADSDVASAARQSLLEVEPRIVANVIEESEEGVREIVSFYASQPSHPVILEAILRRRQVAPETLASLAANLPPDLQEILLLRQDAIVEHPSILDGLEENPELGAYASRRIKEYREHLLPRLKEAPPEAGEEEPAVKTEQVTDGDVVEAVLEARKKPADGERDESTGLSEAQIRALPVPVRLKLCRGASRTLRNILIKDNNPIVARAVLFGNAISDSEIEQIASSRVVADEVLETIGRSRQFTRKYAVVHALVRNPRTPVGMAVRFVPRLAVRDLKSLSRDHNVADAVRSTASRLYKIKQH